MFILVHVFWCFGLSPTGPVTVDEVALHVLSTAEGNFPAHGQEEKQRKKYLEYQSLLQERTLNEVKCQHR